jgi:formylglycine-generating enzyme required for sulfatase activity
MSHYDTQTVLMIKHLLEVLGKVDEVLKLELTQEDVVDALWLAQYIDNKPTLQPEIPNQQNLTDNQAIPSQTQENLTQPPITQTTPTIPVVTHNRTSGSNLTGSSSSDGVVFKAPSAPALREPLKLARALRALMLKLPSSTETVLDEVATAQRIAEEKICIPVLKPTLEPWWEVALVVDESPSMAIWRQTLIALQKLLEGHGAFRDVRSWGMIVQKQGKREIRLRSGIGKTARNRLTHKPGEITDPNGHRLIIVVSDCVSPAWRDGSVTNILSTWGRSSPVVIVQMLPEWLWERSALGFAAPVKLRSLIPGTPNQKLRVEDLAAWDEVNINSGVKVPVITLEAEAIATWAQMVAGAGNTKTVGFVFDSSETHNSDEQNQPPTSISPEQRVYRFLNNASFTARKLAALLASAPVICLPVVQMIQEQMLKESRQVHVAEVFLGGLLKSTSLNVSADIDPDDINYDFIDSSMRSILFDTLDISTSINVLNAVSDFVEKNAGLSIRSFMAKLLDPTSPGNEAIDEKVRPFALVTIQLLKRLGGQPAQIAQRLQQQLIQIDNFTVLNITPKNFEFETVTVNRRGEIIQRETKQAKYFTEDLGNSTTLDMVYIPSGKFMMGSPEGEGYESEKPQHEVTVPAFFMGKYPITQAQWREVAALQKVERDLEPDPSYFKGENFPVESISWDDTVEFCARLSNKTGKNYRLPSEAEWEYACRAGTETAFYFGETITSQLANYRASKVFADEPEGECREKTTDVGIFPPNFFGLYDMHGNVWEWCADTWHENYQEAPTDATPWNDTNNNDNQEYLLRGGSWYVNADVCRSAYRYSYFGDDAFFGFRVVCGVAART